MSSESQLVDAGQASVDAGIRFSQVETILRIVVAVQCLGVAIGMLTGQMDSTSIEALGERTGWSRDWQAAMSQFIAIAMLLASPLIIVRQMRTALGAIAVWMLGEALAAMWLDRGYIPQLEPAEHAVRYLGPLALLLWELQGQAGLRYRGTGAFLLRLGASVTFIGHGIVAWSHNPQFVALIDAFTETCFGGRLDESISLKLLSVIGAIDIAVAVWLLFRPGRFVGAYMTAWGILTAFSRLFLFGPAGVHHVLLRAGNGGCALAWTAWWLSERPAANQQIATTGKSNGTGETVK